MPVAADVLVAVGAAACTVGLTNAAKNSAQNALPANLPSVMAPTSPPLVHPKTRIGEHPPASLQIQHSRVNGVFQRIRTTHFAKQSCYKPPISVAVKVPPAAAGLTSIAATTVETNVNRRAFLASSASALTFALLPPLARADVLVPYDWNVAPPMDTRSNFIDWMVKNRGEDAQYLGDRFDRFQALLANRDLSNDSNKRAFLMTPREAFVTKPNLPRTYANAFLDIGFGVTISGPHLVGRMTSSIDVQRGDKVLEIGTGSGYQSAYLANLTDKIWSIEIIKPLADRTRGVYDALITRGYTEFKSITTKNDDGYYGWPENAPFDKIIVTCGIDHIPPPLLRQLRPGGIMVIPVGPPGSQHVLKVTTEQAADGATTVVRSDIYHGSIVNFVPFTKLQGDKIVGTHFGS